MFKPITEFSFTIIIFAFIYDYCEEEDIRILLEIPYQRRIAELYSQGIPFSLKMPEWKSKFSGLFNEIKTVVGK